MIAAKKNLKDMPSALVLALAGLLLGGCGDSSSAQDPQTTPPKVALIMKSLANEFFVNMQRSAEAHQRQQPTRIEQQTIVKKQAPPSGGRWGGFQLRHNISKWV